MKKRIKTFKLVGVLVLPTLQEVLLEKKASSEVGFVIPVYQAENNDTLDTSWYIQMTDEKTNGKTKFEKKNRNSFVSKGKIEFLPEEECVSGLTESDVYFGFKYGEQKYCIGTAGKVKEFLRNYNYSGEDEILKSEIKEFIEEF